MTASDLEEHGVNILHVSKDDGTGFALTAIPTKTLFKGKKNIKDACVHFAGLSIGQSMCPVMQWMHICQRKK
jgi:hypothetical protein